MADKTSKKTEHWFDVYKTKKIVPWEWGFIIAIAFAGVMLPGYVLNAYIGLGFISIIVVACWLLLVSLIGNYLKDYRSSKPIGNTVLQKIFIGVVSLVLVLDVLAVYVLVSDPLLTPSQQQSNTLIGQYNEVNNYYSTKSQQALNVTIEAIFNQDFTRARAGIDQLNQLQAVLIKSVVEMCSSSEIETLSNQKQAQQLKVLCDNQAILEQCKNEDVIYFQELITFIEEIDSKNRNDCFALVEEVSYSPVCENFSKAQGNQNTYRDLLSEFCETAAFTVY